MYVGWERILLNTTEQSVRVGGAASRQLALATCFLLEVKCRPTPTVHNCRQQRERHKPDDNDGPVY